jgi:hypothetical protein
MLDKLLLIAARGPGEIERTIEEYTYELNQVDTCCYMSARMFSAYV